MIPLQKSRNSPQNATDPRVSLTIKFEPGSFLKISSGEPVAKILKISYRKFHETSPRGKKDNSIFPGGDGSRLAAFMSKQNGVTMTAG